MTTFDEHLQHLIKEALQEDIGPGDYSTLSCIPADEQGQAELKIKEDGILAGVQVAKAVFHFMEPGAQFTFFKEDGDTMTNGERAFTVAARVHTILMCERLVLNCMQRMSGIATLTKEYTRLLNGYKTKLLDTRKTTPNFRLLEKEAVRIGGGVNHRMGLYDMIMLKDNHVDYCGNITKAVHKAHRYVQDHHLGLKIEVETRSLADVREALDTGLVDRIMLDNFTPELVAEAVELIAGAAETEASGGINLKNIVAYAQAGTDFVSVGGLIHQARSLDLSLKALA